MLEKLMRADADEFGQVETISSKLSQGRAAENVTGHKCDRHGNSVTSPRRCHGVITDQLLHSCQYQ